jgi:hypothetical protein
MEIKVITVLENWLRNNILGMLLLGAAGSLLAALIISMARKIFNLFFPTVKAKLKKIYIKIAVALITYLIKPSIKDQTTIYMNKEKSQAYYSYLKAKFIAALFFATWLIILISYSISFLDPWVIVAEAVLFFLSVWWALRLFATLAAPWYLDFDKHVREAVAKVSKELANKKNKLKS